jgi:hypothetical protein
MRSINPNGMHLHRDDAHPHETWLLLRETWLLFHETWLLCTSIAMMHTLIRHDFSYMRHDSCAPSSRSRKPSWDMTPLTWDMTPMHLHRDHSQPALQGSAAHVCGIRWLCTVSCPMYLFNCLRKAMCMSHFSCHIFEVMSPSICMHHVSYHTFESCLLSYIWVLSPIICRATRASAIAHEKQLWFHRTHGFQIAVGIASLAYPLESGDFFLFFIPPCIFFCLNLTYPAVDISVCDISVCWREIPAVLFVVAGAT